MERVPMSNQQGCKLITNTKRSRIILKHNMQMNIVKSSKWKMKQLYKCETIGTKIKRKYNILSAVHWCYYKDQHFRNPKEPQNSALYQEQINRDSLLIKKI